MYIINCYPTNNAAPVNFNAICTGHDQERRHNLLDQSGYWTQCGYIRKILTTSSVATAKTRENKAKTSENKQKQSENKQKRTQWAQIKVNQFINSKLRPKLRIKLMSCSHKRMRSVNLYRHFVVFGRQIVFWLVKYFIIYSWPKINQS